MGSLSFVMYFGKLIITRKLSCTLYFFEKVVKWCMYYTLGNDFDIVTANILADVIMPLSGVIRPHMAAK